jgi:CheY-like chemotaxis protein
LLSGRRKLLLADDSPTIQKVISLTFGDEGLEVVAVGDGESALSALAEEPPPDILLADAVMPGPDGYALCERVKRDARLGHVPVVLLVGAFEPFNEAEARRVGADTVLTKPFQSIRDLVSKVGSLLGGGGGSEPSRETEPGRARDDGAAPRGEPAAQPSAEAFAPVDARGAAEFGAPVEEVAADPAASFADLGADDEMIEARPADAFGAAAGAAGFTPGAEAARPFAETHGEPGLHVARPSESGGGAVSPAASGASEADGFGRRSAGREWGQSEESLTEWGQAEEVLTEQTDEIAMHETTSSQSPFDTFDARAEDASAADDALLDLGRADSSATAATAEADDFILDLDLDDEPPAHHAAAAGEVLDEPFFETAPAAQHVWADAPSAFAEAAHGEQARAVETHAPAATADAADEPWRDVVMQDGPQGFAFGGEEPQAMGAAPQAVGVAPRGFVEPEVVPAEAPVPAVVEGEFNDGSVEGDVPKPPAREMTAGASAAPADAMQQPTAAGFAVGESRAGVEELPRADQLSPEAVDAIARRVVELMSDRVVREIAWEVVPELAELIIRRRLDEENRK